MTIGIVGLGYVGLPLAVAFAEEGVEVVGVDLEARKVEALRSGRSYVEDVSDARVAAAAQRIQPSTRYADLARTEAILIAVPTPLTRNREPDLGPLVDAARSLAGVLQAGQLVVLESTTYPGTTRERLVPLLEESGLAAGSDFHLAFSPERVDPGRTDYTLRTTPKVVGGLTARCLAAAVSVYETVCDEIVTVSSPEAAELSKLLENIFRSVNIALVNELAQLCDRMGIDVWEVVDAAATKPFGFMSFQPGPGLGGHCMPIDPFYLTWKAREFDFYTEFIELAGKINDNMPYWCLGKIARALNGHSRSIKGSNVLLLGVSYKADIGDMRESPALKLIKLLRQGGAELAYYDPHVPELPEQGLSSLATLAPGEHDCVVIVTAHSGIDYAQVVADASLVVDLRNATGRLGAESDKVWKL